MYQDKREFWREAKPWCKACACALSLDSVRLSATPWTVVHQTPLSVEFYRQVYWSGVAISFCRDSSRPRDLTRVSVSPELAGGFFTPSITWETPSACYASNTSAWNIKFTVGFGGFPCSSAGKESAHNEGDPGSLTGPSWVRKILWRRDRLPSPVFLGFPGASDGKESAHKAGHVGSIPRFVKSQTQIF